MSIKAEAGKVAHDRSIQVLLPWGAPEGRLRGRQARRNGEQTWSLCLGWNPAFALRTVSVFNLTAPVIVGPFRILDSLLSYEVLQGSRLAYAASVIIIICNLLECTLISGGHRHNTYAAVVVTWPLCLCLVLLFINKPWRLEHGLGCYLG